MHPQNRIGKSQIIRELTLKRYSATRSLLRPLPVMSASIPAKKGQILAPKCQNLHCPIVKNATRLGNLQSFWIPRRKARMVHVWGSRVLRLRAWQPLRQAQGQDFGGKVPLGCASLTPQRRILRLRAWQRVAQDFACGLPLRSRLNGRSFDSAPGNASLRISPAGSRCAHARKPAQLPPGTNKTWLRRRCRSGSLKSAR